MPRSLRAAVNMLSVGRLLVLSQRSGGGGGREGGWSENDKCGRTRSSRDEEGRLSWLSKPTRAWLKEEGRTIVDLSGEADVSDREDGGSEGADREGGEEQEQGE